jgi:hypothetical protein
MTEQEKKIDWYSKRVNKLESELKIAKKELEDKEFQKELQVTSLMIQASSLLSTEERETTAGAIVEGLMAIK